MEVKCLALAPFAARGSRLRLGAWQGVGKMDTRGHLSDRKTSQLFGESQQKRWQLGLNKDIQAGVKFPPLRLLLLFSGP